MALGLHKKSVKLVEEQPVKSERSMLRQSLELKRVEVSEKGGVHTVNAALYEVEMFQACSRGFLNTMAEKAERVEVTAGAKLALPDGSGPLAIVEYGALDVQYE